MEVIFECETELGQCDQDRVCGHFDDAIGDWLALGHTSATQTSAKGVLRVEQRCYLRSAQQPEEIRAQSWIRPEFILEPALTSKSETTRFVQRLHETYVARARQELARQALILAPSAVAAG